MTESYTPTSPCIGLCHLHEGKCAGCGRTVDEIMAWATASNERRWEIIEAADERLDAEEI